MEKTLSDLDANVDDLVLKISSALGKNPKEVVKSAYGRDTQDFIRSKIPKTLHLTPSRLPRDLISDLRALDKQHRAIAEETLVDPEGPSMSSGREVKPPPVEGELELNVSALSDPRSSFSMDQVFDLADNKVFPKRMTKDQLSLLLWQLAVYVARCSRHCKSLRERANADLARIKEEANKYGILAKAREDAIQAAKEHIVELEAAMEHLERERSRLSQQVKDLSASVQVATEEDARVNLMQKLSQLHPSLVQRQWVNIDQKTGTSDFTYPIFHEGGKFKNPYLTCATESDVANVNSNLPGVYPYMTIMTMVLTVLPPSVKTMFIKELSSARDALEFFLSLNAVARMSPIINHCIRALRDTRDKDDIRELESSMMKVGDQMSLNHNTMVKFLDQSETSRNELVTVAKLIQSFIEKFPGVAATARDSKLKSPNLIRKLITVGPFLFAFKGETPRSAKLVRDLDCEDKESETAIMSCLTPILPAVFTLVRDKYLEEACSLISYGLIQRFKGQELPVVLSNWPE